MKLFWRKNKKEVLNSEARLVHDIFKTINKKKFVYLIKSNSTESTSSLFDVNNDFIEYTNDTIKIFQTFIDSIEQEFKNVGILIIYPNEKNRPTYKKIKHFNPELFSRDLAELIIYQEFGYKPQKLERQEILTESISKESIKGSLVYACYENNKEKIIDTLKTAKKSDLNKLLKYTGTPLTLCAEHDNLQGFKAIVNAGANISKKSHDTPLSIAFTYSSNIVRYIYDNHKDIFEKEINKKGFYIASYCKDIGLFSLLKKSGADLNKYKPDFPHLHNLVKCNNIIGVEFCIQNGVDINMKDKYKQTALDIATSRNFRDIITLLKKHGAIE